MCKDAKYIAIVADDDNKLVAYGSYMDRDQQLIKVFTTKRGAIAYANTLKKEWEHSQRRSSVDDYGIGYIVTIWHLKDNGDYFNLNDYQKVPSNAITWNRYVNALIRHLDKYHKFAFGEFEKNCHGYATCPLEDKNGYSFVK